IRRSEGFQARIRAQRRLRVYRKTRSGSSNCPCKSPKSACADGPTPRPHCTVCLIPKRFGTDRAPRKGRGGESAQADLVRLQPRIPSPGKEFLYTLKVLFSAAYSQATAKMRLSPSRTSQGGGFRIVSEPTLAVETAASRDCRTRKAETGGRCADAPRWLARFTPS